MEVLQLKQEQLRVQEQRESRLREEQLNQDRSDAADASKGDADGDANLPHTDPPASRSSTRNSPVN